MALYDLMPAKDSPALALFSRVFMIWPIKLLLPLTILRLILAYSTHPHLHHSYLDIHAALEILLFIHYLVKRHVLTARPAAAHSYVYPKIDRQTPLPPLKHLKQCLSHIKASLPDPRDASRRQQDIANWFIDLDQGRTNQIPTFSQIHRTQAATWLSWAFWDSPLTPTLLLETAPLVDAMEAWAGAKFEATATPTHNVKPLTLTLDPPRCQHHPLLHYIVTHVFANLIGYIVFTVRGFKRGVLNGQVYYHRPCDPSLAPSETKKPLIYISGIGIGLISYEALINALVGSAHDRDVLLFDLPELSLRWTPGMQHSHASPLQTAETVNQLIRSCVKGEEGAHAVAHSFGCICVQWIIRLAPDESPITSLTFVDPVCFLLISPSVAANFCYRFPKTFLDLLVSYFVAREIGVNNALHRHFQWKVNNLDPQLLPENSSVVLSEFDAFVPSELVKNHLKCERPDVRVEVLKGHFHSQFSVVKESFQLVAEMSRECDVN